MTAAPSTQEIDPELWLPCPHTSGDRDYLYSSLGGTFPGRMPAWCERRQVSFRVSLSELDWAALPVASRYWVRGFLAGSVPQFPQDDEADLDRFCADSAEFLRTGSWPRH